MTPPLTTLAAFTGDLPASAAPVIAPSPNQTAASRGLVTLKVAGSGKARSRPREGHSLLQHPRRGEGSASKKALRRRSPLTHQKSRPDRAALSREARGRNSNPPPVARPSA